MKDFLRKLTPEKVLLFYHKCLAVMANIIYGFPGRRLNVVGVTGTNGKTTTSLLIADILEEAGYKAGMTSTVYFKLNKKIWLNKTKMTVSGHLTLPRMLKKMVKNKCQYAVLEVSSHAIRQYRTWGIPFSGAVITNLTHDHLDYHKDFSAYRETKGELFASLNKKTNNNLKKVSVVNADDKNAWYFAQFPADKKFAYTMEANDIGIPLVKAEDIKFDNGKICFLLVSPEESINIRFNLMGRFNIANALAASAFALSQGVDLKTIKKGLEKIKGLSGRMEEVMVGQDFKVFVDYAHTPDAFQKVFESIKPMAKNKIISVFGATGDRDKGKRPVLGEIAAEFSNYIVLTLEDPGSEDPEKIIVEIEPGLIQRGKKINMDYFKIVDREKAIKKAFDLAEKDDIVLLLAKGHEKVMQMKNKKIPWDEKKIAERLLKNLSKKD